MLKATSSLLLFSLCCANTYAQEAHSSLTGQIIGKESRNPISFVHVMGSGEQTVADAEGTFSIHFAKGDTLTFSHINYQRYSVVIADVPDGPLLFSLTKKENILQEVIIRDYLPEEELKQEMIEHKVRYTVEEVNAINNVAFSTVLYKKGFVPEMNSLDNFKNYIKEPQGITLFSSDPSKGLINSIKKLSQQNKIFYKSELKLNQTKPDTLQNHLFLRSLQD